MKESDYAEQATKKIETAIPTVASDGSVIRWEISFSYTLNDFKKVYEQEIFWMEEGEEMFQPKPPDDFTKTELSDLLPIAAWNGIFMSQYESLHPKTNALEIRIDEKFDIKKIKE
tara:strand:- start:715 stop:1059 length:345 start_codon:yes stop_codon:yes gene_type:complete